jgi:Protein of unknown function (DUF4242)
VVYVVERYLPGRAEADLEPMFQRLRGATRALQAEGIDVRYVGSTIVPDDEACFCQFEAPSEQAVAAANRRAQAPFDRIVPGVRVPAAARKEGGTR